MRMVVDGKIRLFLAIVVSIGTEILCRHIYGLMTVETNPVQNGSAAISSERSIRFLCMIKRGRHSTVGLIGVSLTLMASAPHMRRKLHLHIVNLKFKLMCYEDDYDA